MKDQEILLEPSSYRIEDNLNKEQLTFLSDLRKKDFLYQSKEIRGLRLKLVSLEVLNDRLKKEIQNTGNGSNRTLRNQLTEKRREFFKEITETIYRLCDERK